MHFRMSGIAIAAGIIVSAPAAAADLGGNCCADLEERIAELEATTARKGNRKVSLTIYGQVNEGIIGWDDGFENNATLVTNDNSRSRFGFKGEAKINGDWKAGYQLEIGVRSNNSKRFDQNNNKAPADENGLDLRHSRWFLTSKTFGSVSVGTGPTAMESITEINLANTKDAAKYSDVEDTGLGLLLRGQNGGLSSVQWRRLIKHTGDAPGEGERRPGIWYQSPDFGGFSFESGWGADDHWDVGLRYKGEWAGFKMAAGAAYGETTNEDSEAAFFECVSTSSANVTSPTGSRADCQQYGGSLSVMHSATGLYFNLAGGVHQDDNVLNDSDFAGTNADDESKFWAIEVGLEQKFIEVGKTTFFGQYYDIDGGANSRITVAADDAINNTGIGDANVLSTGLEMYGGGVVQEISNAAMSVYVYYRHYEGDVSLANNGNVAVASPFEDLDMVVGGAIIKF